MEICQKQDWGIWVLQKHPIRLHVGWDYFKTPFYGWWNWSTERLSHCISAFPSQPKGMASVGPFVTLCSDLGKGLFIYTKAISPQSGPMYDSCIYGNPGKHRARGSHFSVPPTWPLAVSPLFPHLLSSHCGLSQFLCSLSAADPSGSFHCLKHFRYLSRAGAPILHSSCLQESRLSQEVLLTPTTNQIVDPSFVPPCLPCALYSSHTE